MPKFAVLQTRKSASCPVFGSLKDLDPEKTVLLPTYEDVIRCYHSTRQELKGDGSKQPSTSEVGIGVAIKFERIWERASLPIVSHNRVTVMITTYNKKYQQAIKPLKGRDSNFLNSKLLKFKTEAEKLFDICSYKCPEIHLCNCKRTCRVPKEEWLFLQDQRNERKMGIGGIDKTLTQQLQRKIERQAKEQKRYTFVNAVNMEDPVPSSSGIQNTVSKIQDSSFEDEAEDGSSDEDFMWSDPLENRRKVDTAPVLKQMRIPMPKTAIAADLTGQTRYETCFSI